MVFLRFFKKVNICRIIEQPLALVVQCWIYCLFKKDSFRTLSANPSLSDRKAPPTGMKKGLPLWSSLYPPSPTTL